MPMSANGTKSINSNNASRTGTGGMGAAAKSGTGGSGATRGNTSATRNSTTRTGMGGGGSVSKTNFNSGGGTKTYSGPKGTTSLSQAARMASVRSQGLNIPNVPHSARDSMNLAKMMQAESGSIRNKFGNISVPAAQSVADVVRNRVLSERFPNSVSGVLGQDKQFSPMADGSFKKARPDHSLVSVADAVLRGEVAPNVGGALNYGNLQTINGMPGYSSQRSKTAFNSMSPVATFADVKKPGLQHSFGTIGQPTDVSFGGNTSLPNQYASIGGVENSVAAQGWKPRDYGRPNTAVQSSGIAQDPSIAGRLQAAQQGMTNISPTGNPGEIQYPAADPGNPGRLGQGYDFSIDQPRPAVPQDRNEQIQQADAGGSWLGNLSDKIGTGLQQANAAFTDANKKINSVGGADNAVGLAKMANFLGLLGGGHTGNPQSPRREGTGGSQFSGVLSADAGHDINAPSTAAQPTSPYSFPANSQTASWTNPQMLNPRTPAWWKQYA